MVDIKAWEWARREELMREQVHRKGEICVCHTVCLSPQRVETERESRPLQNSATGLEMRQGNLKWWTGRRAKMLS